MIAANRRRSLSLLARHRHASSYNFEIQRATKEKSDRTLETIARYVYNRAFTSQRGRLHLCKYHVMRDINRRATDEENSYSETPGVSCISR